MRTHTTSAGTVCAFANLAAALHDQTTHHAHAARDTIGGAMNTQIVNPITGGIKAGLSGYQGVQEKQAFSQLASHISWYSDYQANTSDASGVVGVPMVCYTF